MKLVIGDLWDEEKTADLILVSCNAVTTRSGYVVMGRGAAREATQRWPGIQFQLGERILYVRDEADFYGVIWTEPGWHISGGPTFALGAFQVKHHWKDAANLDLIKRSTEKLRGIALVESELGFKRIAMNFPGIGNGRLDPGDVIPIIRELPDKVYVYQKA